MEPILFTLFTPKTETYKMRQRESEIEKRLVSIVKEKGGLCSTQLAKGTKDRVCYIPMIRFYFSK